MTKTRKTFRFKKQYPCSICKRDCEDKESVLCFGCGKWVHSKCVGPGMPTELTNRWSTRGLKFYCQNCCFSGDQFDSQQSLLRIATIAEGGNSVQFSNATATEALLLETYNVKLPEPSEVIPLQYVDAVTAKILNGLAPAVLKSRVPVETYGDGNCLYRAVSQGMFGRQSLHFHLRLITALEIVHNRSAYDSSSKDFVDRIQDNRILTSPYTQLVRDAFRIGSFSDLQHMYALSAALGKPIQSYYPPLVSSTFHTEPYHRKVIGRTVNASEEAAVTVMWTSIASPISEDAFVPNHFVPLIKRCTVPTETVNLDLSSDDNQSNPVRNDDLFSDDEDDDDDDDDAPHATEPRHRDNKKKIMSDKDSYEDENGDAELDGNTDDHSLSEDSSGVENTEMKPTVSVSESGEHLKNCDFLSLNELLDKLKKQSVELRGIPEGAKNNICFLINNVQNIERRSKNIRSDFSDDCGVWISSKGGTPKTFFVILEDGSLKSVVYRNAQFCYEKQINKKKTFVSLDPQPGSDQIVVLNRHYSSLKSDPNYKKRVSWIEKAPKNQKLNSNVAVVEYKGIHSGFSAHGNSKRGNEYVRTSSVVMEEMGKLVKTMRPKNVYNKLLNECDETLGPAAPRQVRDKKYRDKKTLLKDTVGVTTNRNNFADCIVAIQNMMHKGHNLIKQVVHDSGNSPCVILYNDEMIRDIKNLCCSGQTVLGFDKTFNICDVHVTPSVYKQLSVVSNETGEPPLFVGPLFLHDSSDFEIYSIFFSHLKTKLADSDTSNLVIGSDQEGSLRKAIVNNFPDATHVICTRHIKQNVSEKLKNGVGIRKRERQEIEKLIFGQEGITSADDSIIFDDRCEKLEQSCKNDAPDFLTYFSRLKPILREKVMEPQRVGKIEKGWTNNNCESYNHVLKVTVDWKPQSLLDFVSKVTEAAEAYYKDLKRTLFNRGPYRLAKTHTRFQVDRNAWISKTMMERHKCYARFRRFVAKTNGLVYSTDGKSVIRDAKSKGKKKGQRKRRLAERTQSFKKQRVI